MVCCVQFGCCNGPSFLGIIVLTKCSVRPVSYFPIPPNVRLNFIMCFSFYLFNKCSISSLLRDFHCWMLEEVLFVFGIPFLFRILEFALVCTCVFMSCFTPGVFVWMPSPHPFLCLLLPRCLFPNSFSIFSSFTYFAFGYNFCDGITNGLRGALCWFVLD